MSRKRLFEEADDILPSSQSSESSISDFVVPVSKRTLLHRGISDDVLDDAIWKSWTVEKLATFLEDKNLKDEAALFREQNICGQLLPMLNEERLKQIGIEKLGQRLRVLQVVEYIQEVYIKKDYKIFNDSIHGHIELHPLCVKIIDTPQFQRLRFLKQLGWTYSVYPGASHNRFEHSLGVCHLAGKWCRALKKRQPELMITDEDVLCVEIAGLCHDLGHGPFSHLFDIAFMSTVRPERKWKHEHGSVALFEYLVESNGLRPVFKQYNLTDKELIFIKEQIAGEYIEDLPYRARTPPKSFLYEIVANKRNGIDVDKWDYFARDCHMLGIRNNFDHDRFIKFSRVLNVKGELQICLRDKEAENLYNMFHTRETLHRRAYQHKVCKIIEIMITEAMVKANDHLRIPGENGKLLKMSDVVDDMEALSNLTDSVIYQILQDQRPELADSKEILRKVMKRQLYKYIGQISSTKAKFFSRDDKQQVQQAMVDLQEKDGSVLNYEDLVINLVFLDYGMKTQNPVDHVRFYSKKDPTVAIRVGKEQVSQMLPERFAEQQLIVYCKLQDTRSLDKARQCFIRWCEVNNYPSPKDS